VVIIGTLATISREQEMNNNRTEQNEFVSRGIQPNFKILKVGIVSRDYRCDFNGHCDFSANLEKLLSIFDQAGCEVILFSLFSFRSRQGFSIKKYFANLNNIKLLMFETFQFDETNNYKSIGNHAYFVDNRINKYINYTYQQKFGSLSAISNEEMRSFVENEVPLRIFGNSISLICGETNGVKYSKKEREVEDTYSLRKAIPADVKIILNPIHDKMTRFEMKLKRIFLSQNNRWIISVWNKGKKDKNGTVKDGANPAWTVYHNGAEVTITPIENNLNYEIGIVDIRY
jgi:hypothetical protein